MSLYAHATLTPFWTEYGLVFRIQKDMSVGPDYPDEKAKGEWRTMGISNWLISKRFGRRRRFYVQHQAKSVSFAHIQELALVWPEWLAQTSAHAFREREGGEGDVYHMFALAHFVVERAREALLWTWVVGRVGGLDDSWGEHEMQRAWIELGGEWEGEGSREIHVVSGRRQTLETDRVREYLKEGGIEGQFHTDYHFCAYFVWDLACPFAELSSSLPRRLCLQPLWEDRCRWMADVWRRPHPKLP